jgi:hypothetical protein
MSDAFSLIWLALIGLFRSRASLQVEILTLRHQLNVCGVNRRKRTCAGSYADMPPVIYNVSRTHRSLNKDAPLQRAIERLGAVVSRPVLGGLHHQYCRI